MATVQSITVRWAFPTAALARCDGASKVRNGNAQGRRLQGRGTANAMQTHCMAQQAATRRLLARTASRYIPLAAMRAPLRRSRVSSTTTRIGQPGGSNIGFNPGSMA